MVQSVKQLMAGVQAAPLALPASAPAPAPFLGMLTA
jgi:hypothetical protein